MSMILEGIPVRPHRAPALETPIERAVRHVRDGVLCLSVAR
jgi:hypothetical protein